MARECLTTDDVNPPRSTQKLTFDPKIHTKHKLATTDKKSLTYDSFSMSHRLIYHDSLAERVSLYYQRVITEELVFIFFNIF